METTDALLMLLIFLLLVIYILHTLLRAYGKNIITATRQVCKMMDYQPGSKWITIQELFVQVTKHLEPEVLDCLVFLIEIEIKESKIRILIFNTVNKMVKEGELQTLCLQQLPLDYINPGRVKFFRVYKVTDKYKER